MTRKSLKTGARLLLCAIAALFLLAFAGMASADAEPPAAAEQPQLRLRPVCNDGQLVGLQILATGPGMWAVRFNPHNLCAGDA
jgi:hypothetical protein